MLNPEEKYMFNQGDLIRDYVFPIAVVTPKQDGVEFVSFLGTGFLIGSRGYALTARHVVIGKDKEPLAGMFVGSDSSWHAFRLEVVENKDDQDVSLLKFLTGTWKSFFVVSGEHVNAALEYHLFGYPADSLYEDFSKKDWLGRVGAKPDLIYSKGHVRRRISWNLGIPNIIGNAFIELSSVAGDGCSGSPVFKVLPRKTDWTVVGIYTAERINDRATSVSYAVRSDSFFDWTPAALGHSIAMESIEK